MKRRRKKSLNHTHITVVLIITAIIIFTVFAVWTDKAVRPVASMQAEHFSLLTTNESIEQAVSEYLEKNSCTYSDFSAVIYDESGRPAAIEAIPYNINKVQSELALMINRELEKNSKDSVKIPLGSLTDSYMLAGKGPYIRLRICPAQKASVKLKSSFTSAGNNQTCHRISAEVTAEIKSSLPLYNFETTAEFEFLLAESIIVGEVPENARYAWNEY